ncbi:MAG: hypothetical protein ACI38U_07760 [Corynebacterium sp.]|uniref:hypothetical protein n=1 Tax=Corynebacterium sp. TaxID=1720 RepID=UPI003F047A88
MFTTRRTLTSLSAAALTATLVACGSDDADTASGTTPTTSATTGGNVASTEDQNAEVHSLYNEVLDNLDTDNFTSDDAVLYDRTGAFEYSIVDINGDDLPEMLVAAVGETFSNARVYTVDAAGVVETDALFAYGAATGGGGRAEFHTSAESRGVFKTLGRSGNGQYTTTRWTLEGDEMVEGDDKWDYRSDRKPDDLAKEQVEVEWTPVGDRSLLGGDAASDTEAPDDGPNPDRPDAPAEPDADAEAPADTGGRSKADFPNFGGNSATSDQFARAVYNQFIEEYIATGNTSPSLQVASPTTGETYTMTCTPSTMYVTCTGGTDASVGIYPPIDDPSTLPGEVQWG